MPVLPGMPVTTLRRSPGRSLGLIQVTCARIGRHGGIDQQPLERMIEIPVIDDVLVIPDDLSGVGVQRQRRVVIEVLSCRCRRAGTWARARSRTCRRTAGSARRS